MKKMYFPSEPGMPIPLEANTSRRVRFEEVDVLGVVWHGRYPSYFEDARVALGSKYGVGYLDLYHQGIVTPIKQAHVEYMLPLHFDEEFTVIARLHYTEAARMNLSYEILNAEGRTATTGYTVQLFMETDHSLLMAPPPFYQDFLARWRAGELTP